MDYCLIYNPVSGKGLGAKTAQSMKALLDQKGYAVGIFPTLADPEAFKQSLIGLQQETTVVCIGGDGTLLYFLNSDAPFKNLAFYGMGTANVIRIEYDIPQDLNAFIKMLETGKTELVRPGQLDDGTHFLMMASFGMDAHILTMGSQKWKNRIGKWAFLLPGLRGLLRYRYPAIQVTLDSGERYQAYFAVVARFKHYGGRFVMAPDATASSQSFEVVLLQKRGFLALARLMMRVTLKKTPKGPGVVIAKTKQLQVETAAPLQIDGDFYPGLIHRMAVSDMTFQLIVP